MIHGLNPIYKPQGISPVSMMAPVAVWQPPSTSTGQMRTAQAASAEASVARAEARYIKVFDGQPRTVKELAAIMKISADGVSRQIRKFADRNRVRKVECGAWIWCGL